ncbi:MAG: Ig-like domain-containing protein [Bacteroidales bacterium]|nr:Ig-like domain-containing protein [Bacteroidales bacterium]MCM1147457.1 Ig-like domain-containing protein [Bacteroidales bacterium]MCM1206126.1 Ig-like domain-containing protein [Bacillota bacterium]MCM1510043.1 Ig-like domain-containing protein [Clostridium sp.]
MKKTLIGIRPVKSAGMPTAVTNIILSEQDITLPINREVMLFAFAMPENDSVRWLDFSSSDSSIATVDKYGKIKAINAGTVTITVSATDVV